MNKRKKITLSFLAALTIMTSCTGVTAVKADSTLSMYNVKTSNLVVELENTNALSLESSLTNYVYNAYANRIINNSISIPITGQMVPQGITTMGEYIITTSYDSTGKNNSIINVIDKNGQLINTCTLNNKAHVGGIGYDEKNNLIWISNSNGQIDAYDANQILYKTEILPKYANLEVGNGLSNYKYPWLNAVSYLTIYDNKIYVGNFTTSEKGLVKEYTINLNPESKVITLNCTNYFNVPTKVQGLTFYEDENSNKYIIFSRSYGRDTSSILQIFNYSEEITDYSNSQLKSITYEAPPMMEQITNSNDQLYTIYESSADEYSNSTDPIEKICVVDTKELINSKSK